jgi:hypothetical protein
MKNLPLYFIAVLVLFTFGCSNNNGTSSPVQQNPTPDIASTDSSEQVILGAGTMNLATGETDPARDLSGYLNVTPYLGGNFMWEIVDFDEDWLEIQLNLQNPTSLTVHDVIIVFDELYGKEVEGDGWNDITAPFDIDPFVAFMRDDPDRVFPGYASDSQTMWIEFPTGANPMVKYVIYAHLGGNTGGVYGFEDCFTDGVLMEEGGETTIYAYPLDHQGDFAYVAADTSLFTGGITFLTPSGNPGEWSATISNTKGAPQGNYEFWVGAYSQSSPEYRSYWLTWVEVGREPKTLYVDDDNTSGPWDGTLAHPYQYVQDALDHCYQGDTIWIKPGIYNEDPLGNLSSPDAEISIPSERRNLTIYGEGSPVIVLHDYEGDYDPAGITGWGNENLVVEGLEFRPGSFYKYAMKFGGCKNLQIRNCSVTPGIIGFSGFLDMNSCDGAVIENNSCDGMICNTTNLQWPVEIINLIYCNNCKFTLNSIRGLTQTAPGTSQSQSYELEIVNFQSCDNSEFSKNIIGDFEWVSHNDYISILHVVRVSFSENSQIRNNLIHHLTHRNEITTSVVSETRGFEIGGFNDGLQVFNNTLDSLYQAGTGSLWMDGIWIENAGASLSFYNNIITNLDSDNYGGNVFGFASGYSFEQSYSDVWNMGQGNGDRYYWEAYEGAGGLNVDPMFVDYMAGNYRLAPGSLCRGSGLGGYDMGCYGGADPLP